MPGIKYRYYDTPDGEDLYKKLCCLMRPTLDFSFGLAVTDIMLFTTPIGFYPMLYRFSSVFVRPLTTAFIFPTTVYMATKIRKKDDCWNHAFGVLCCGYYWRRFIGIPEVTIPLTVLIALTAAIFKHVKNDGVQVVYDFYNLREEIDYGATSRFLAWTWNKQLPRTWLTEEEAAAKGIEY